MGATLPQQITRVVIPASIPTVLTGLRLGGALTIIGVVVSEMLTSSAGIGYLVTRYRTILDSPHVFAAILMILLLSILFDLAARAVERRTLVWQIAGRNELDFDRWIELDLRYIDNWSLGLDWKILPSLQASLGRFVFADFTGHVLNHKLDGAQEAHLIALTCSTPPAGHARWTLRLLAERFVLLDGGGAVSYEHVRRLLKKANSSPG